MAWGTNFSSLCMDFTTHLQGINVHRREQFCDFCEHAARLYSLSLLCPYMWLGGYLALWINRVEKNLCVRSPYRTRKISTFLWFSNGLSSLFCTHPKPSEMLSKMSSSLDHFMHYENSNTPTCLKLSACWCGKSTSAAESIKHSSA